jgi:transposase
MSPKSLSDKSLTLDLSCFYKKVSTEGNPAYHPATMLRFTFMHIPRDYSTPERLPKRSKNIAFIFLAAWQKPEFRSISDFRKNNLKELDMLFSQIVLLCKRLRMQIFEKPKVNREKAILKKYSIVIFHILILF